ncbi:hypothetical protein NXC24_PB00363 (plasmid) [Rhizobium sp. NXC24]|nr:hypothetical protein NXC24_PB00363 [Rhizobium sp. NXC24]
MSTCASSPRASDRCRPRRSLPSDCRSLAAGRRQCLGSMPRRVLIDDFKVVLGVDFFGRAHILVAGWSPRQSNLSIEAEDSRTQA